MPLPKLIATSSLGEIWQLVPDEQATPEPPQSAEAPRLRTHTLEEFLALDIEPLDLILKPILPEKGTAMIYAARGTGKTHVALGIAFAVATGGKFLKWEAERPRKVLLIDGEMPAELLQQRLAEIIQANPSATLGDDMLRLCVGDLIEQGGVGNLNDPKVQAELDPLLDGVELVILDNLSSLTTVFRDNDADSWNAIQAWLLRLRRRRIAVLLIHHAGKGGRQRGTSRREDILNTVISLRRPDDYQPSEGARFEVHIEKARGLFGREADPFEARMQTDAANGATIWTMRDMADVHLVKVRAAIEDGAATFRAVEEMTEIPKSTVNRIMKAAGLKFPSKTRQGSRE